MACRIPALKFTLQIKATIEKVAEQYVQSSATSTLEAFGGSSGQVSETRSGYWHCEQRC